MLLHSTSLISFYKKMVLTIRVNDKERLLETDFLKGNIEIVYDSAGIFPPKNRVVPIFCNDGILQPVSF